MYFGIRLYWHSKKLTAVLHFCITLSLADATTIRLHTIPVISQRILNTQALDSIAKNVKQRFRN